MYRLGKTFDTQNKREKKIPGGRYRFISLLGKVPFNVKKNESQTDCFGNFHLEQKVIFEKKIFR